MAYFRIKLIFGLLFFLYSSVTYSQDQMLEEWDRTTPSYRLFSKGIIKECPNCETFVIIASSKEVSTELTNTIKKIVKKVDKNLTHQGVIMHRNQLLLQANELTALNCKLPSVEEINVFYYADRELRECVKLPYDSEDFLRVALENVYGYFDNNEKVFKKLNEVNNEERIRVYKADAKKFIGENYDYLRDLVAVLIVEKITGSKK